MSLSFLFLELIQVVHTVLLWHITCFAAAHSSLAGFQFSSRFLCELKRAPLGLQDSCRIAVLELLTGCSKGGHDDRGPWMLAVVSSPGPLTAWRLVGILQSC